MSAPWRLGSAVAFDRLAVEAEIEKLIALLDYIDGDCDLEEDNPDCCPAFEDRLYTMGHIGMDGPGDPEDAEDDDPLEDDEKAAATVNVSIFEKRTIRAAQNGRGDT